jgi:O-antigen ligase
VSVDFEILGETAEGRVWTRVATKPLIVISSAILTAVIVAILSCAEQQVLFAALFLIGTVLFLWGIIYVIRKPEWLGFAFIFEELLPYANIIPEDPASRWYLRFPLLLPLSFPAVWVSIRSGILWCGRFKGFLFYFAWAAISVLYSLRPEISGGRLFGDVLLFCALGAITASVKGPDQVQSILGRFLAGCAIFEGALLFSWLMPSGDTWIVEEGLPRFCGIFSTPNEVGSLAMVTIATAFAYWPSATGWRRYGVISIVAISLFFAASADSRSETFATLVGVISYWIWRRGKTALLTCAIVGGIAFLASNHVSQHFRAYFNRDVTTMTGRTEAWQFELIKLRQKPLIGYGYEVEGEIFHDKHFTNWQNVWDMGPNSALHNGYLAIAIGLGIPALVFWLFLTAGPWIWLMQQEEDRWGLKPLFFLVFVPMLMLGLDESGLGEPRDIRGLLFYLTWQLVEYCRISSSAVLLPTPARLMSSDARVPRVVFGSVLAVAALIGLTARAASAEIYYVDSIHGSDSASGKSPTSAWRSLAKVDHFEFSYGDRVLFARGSEWRETLEPEGADDANFRGVTLDAYGSGPLPLINGSDVLRGWVRSRGPIYSVREPTEVYNVFVDRAPGWGLLRACCLAGASCNASAEAASSGTQCGVRSLVPGSWYWAKGGENRNTLYVWLPNGGDPAAHKIEAVTREFGVSAYVQSHQLDNLRVQNLKIIQTGLRGVSLESGDAAGCCGSRGTGAGAGIGGLVLRDLVVERTGTGQIDDGNYGNAITIINATAPKIEGNKVSYCGNHGNCINVQNSNGAQIIGNTVEHWNHNGIDIKGSRQVFVSSNYAGDKPDDGAAYYTEYSSGVIFDKNRADNVSNGFQISVGARAEVLDNIITRGKTVLYFGPRALAVSVHNNSASGCIASIGTDGLGSLSQGANAWDCHATESAWAN